MTENISFIRELCNWKLKTIHMAGNILCLSLCENKKIPREVALHISVHFMIKESNTIVIDSAAFFTLFDEKELKSFDNQIIKLKENTYKIEEFKILPNNDCELVFNNGLTVRSCAMGRQLKNNDELWRLFVPEKPLNNILIATTQKLEIEKPDEHELLLIDARMKKWCADHPESKVSQLFRPMF